jgi:superfamily II DNA helicase RecQ
VPCETSCNSNFEELQYEDTCVECGLEGWTPGDGIIYPIPQLKEGHFIKGNHSDLSFLYQLIEFPKRTRMNALCSKWDVSSTGPLVNRLEGLRNKIRLFGFDLVQLRDGQNIPEKHAKLVNDEPLVLLPYGQQIIFSGCNHIDVTETVFDSVDDDNFVQMKIDVEAIKEVLQKRDIDFRQRIGSEGLRAEQTDAILQCLRTPRQLNIFSLPTGFGKTRIAQVVSWALRRQNEGPALMVSPLISLMDDQRYQFKVFNEDLNSTIDLGLHTTTNQGYNSVFLTGAESRDTLDLMSLFRNDKMDLLCCSPERLISSSKNLMWMETLCKMPNKISTLIIDEAHIVGDWGASIRPEFQMLSWVKDRLLIANPNLRVILMSATISRDEEKELTNLFSNGLRVADTIRVSQTRKDLYFHIARHSEPLEENADEIVSKLHIERMRVPARWSESTLRNKFQSPLILYSPIKQAAIEILEPRVKKIFGQVEMYTGSTPSPKRESIRKKFVHNEFPCLIGTSAFGMGIDKPDIWTTAYVGMPHTLKGLYQAFGRAARRSHWTHSDPRLWKSGVCFGSIPETWPMGYKSPLGLPKTLERLFDMFCLKNTYILENGYVVVPIKEGLNEKFWIPEVNEALRVDDDDTNDDSLQWSEALLHSEENRVEVMRKLRSQDQLYKNRLWVLSCLQRSGAFTFQGMHASILKIRPATRERKNLIEILSESGYSGVVKILGDLDPSWKLPDQSPHFAVLKVNREIRNWVELGDAAIEGYQILKARHSRGREEIIQFLADVGKNECIRKLFSPTIGLSEDETKTCIELIKAEDYCMPCSNCKLYYPEFQENSDSFIWSTERTLEILGAIKKVHEPLPSIRDITLSENRKRKKRSLEHYPIYKNKEEPINFSELEFDSFGLKIYGRYKIYMNGLDGSDREVEIQDGSFTSECKNISFFSTKANECWSAFLVCETTKTLRIY